MARIGPAEANGRSYGTGAGEGGLLPEAPGRPGPRRLLEAAVEAFAERGYHGVSVRDLTAAVGIKAGSFYAHFPSKEQLLFELMLLGHETHHAHVRDAILGAGADPADQLREGVRANVAFQATYPLLTIVCNSELHALTAENRARVAGLRHDLGVLFSAVIERGNAAGAFSCDDVWLAVYAIGAMGIRVAWWFRPPALQSNDSPLSGYPSEAATWLPAGEYTVDRIADAYVTFAMNIVGAKP